ncbi:hypothetical protein [Anaerosphaera multitolerans]|uniref:hypothetical protein n=1 Tax=Anaerosphaera multitolerans TaxID=2487351 RepID=UPI001F0BBA06|nr:hypothetical protein [Anaerosphaera multitolerans]
MELISFEKNTMKTIKDNVKLRGIITKINGLKGEEVNMENEGLSAMDFINIYDKSFKKTVVGRNNNYLKINDKWYKLDSRSSKNFENIFNQYN